MRRFILPGLVTAAAVALLALLTFGVSNQNDTSSIDAQVANGKFPVAPNARQALPVLGTSAQGEPGRLPRQGGRPQRVRLLV